MTDVLEARRRPRAQSSRRLTHPRVGDAVYADDGPLGRVESIIASERSTPVYVVVTVGSFLRRRYPVIPWSLVRMVDHARHRVYLEGSVGSLARFDESLPIVL